MAKVPILEYINYYLINRAEGLGDHTKKLDEDYCSDLISSLKFLVHHDEYYLVEDLKQMKVTWHFGINEWLGHTKINERPIDFIYNLVHPMVRDIYLAYMCAFFILADDHKQSFRKLKTRFVINIPILKANGSYVLVKQVTTPFQMDDKFNITSYISTYTIADGYRSNPLYPRIFHKEERKRGLENALFARAAKYIEISPEFHLKEMEFKILKACFNLRNSVERTEQIKESTNNHSEKSIKNNSGQINRKIRGYLNFENYAEDSNERKCFAINNDVYSYAFFLGKSGLIEVFEHHYKGIGFQDQKKSINKKG